MSQGKYLSHPFHSLPLFGQLAITDTQLDLLISWNRMVECFWSCEPNALLASCVSWCGVGDETSHLLCIEAPNLPSEIRHFFLASGWQGKFTCYRSCWRSSAFWLFSYTPSIDAWNIFREHHMQNVSPKDMLGASVIMGLWEMGGPMFLPVSRLLVVLAVQWAGEALTLFTPEHQLQSSDELILAHTVSWTTAGNYKIWTLTCKIKKQLAHAPYLLFALFCTCTRFAPFHFLDVLCCEVLHAGLSSFL